MNIKGKLISPTNILLERPLLSPVEISEFRVIDEKDLKKLLRVELLQGASIGCVITASVYIIMQLLVYYSNKGAP